MYGCSLCKISLDDVASFRHHCRRKHAQELQLDLDGVIRIDGVFLCPIANCNRSYSSRDTLAKHFDKHHTDITCTITVADVLDVGNSSDHNVTALYKRRKILPPDGSSFTMAQGSQNALKLSTEQKANHAVSALDCEPVAIHLSHESMAEPHSMFGVFHVNDVNDMWTKLPHESKSISAPLSCAVQLHSETYNISTTDAIQEGANDLIKLRHAVRNSYIPMLLEKNGDYVEPTKTLLDHLNFEFAVNPALLHAVAKLHTGALIVDKTIIFAVAAEAYARSKAIDVHGENDQQSLPTSTSTYGSLCIGVYNEADGGSTKRKLKIGSKKMNILITMATLVNADKTIDIGPETTTTINQIRPSTARIFYRVKEVDEFLKIMAHDPQIYAPPSSNMDINSIRQLTSGYNDASTFLPWRAVHEDFDGGLTMPTTVFTTCNMPHNQGYGSSGVSTAKLASRFLQALALAAMFQKSTPDFTSAITAFSTLNTLKALKDEETASKSWITLTTFVASLEKTLNGHKQLSPLVLGSLLDFNSLSYVASQGIASSNQKVKENVHQQMIQLYSE